MFTLKFSTDNAAFDEMTDGVVATLRQVAQAIENDGRLGVTDGGSIRDVNGNTIGRWELSSR